MDLVAEPLTSAEFKPFCEVLPRPAEPGRFYFNDGLANARPHATVNLSLVRVVPTKTLPLTAKLLERHQFSSQTFLPLKVSRYLVIVAPDAPRGGPDVSRARAFVAASDQGITYRAGTWHHGITVLDEPGDFAVLMWCDGTSGDEEFVPLETPFSVVVPD